MEGTGRGADRKAESLSLQHSEYPDPGLHQLQSTDRATKQSHRPLGLFPTRVLGHTLSVSGSLKRQDATREGQRRRAFYRLSNRGFSGLKLPEIAK